MKEKILNKNSNMNRAWLPVWVRAVLFAVIPVLCCIIACAVKNHGLGDVSLLNSEWNDELFYFKQTEGIIRYGYPLGFFGFNESHAAFLSFAAWSPVLVLPYVIFGKIFGWGLLSPIICNLLLMCLAMFLFVLLTNPNEKQLHVLTFLYVIFRMLTRYILSGMPEIICISHLIILYALAIRYGLTKNPLYLVLQFLLAGLLTLMRPYLILFSLLPVYYFIRETKQTKKIALGITGSLLFLGGTAGIYVLINRFLGAKYFQPLFFTDFITTFFTGGIGAGFHNLFSTLYWKGRDFFRFILECFRSGVAPGAFFTGFLLTAAIALFQGIRHLKKVKKETSVNPVMDKTYAGILFHYVFSCVCMFFALLLMYKLTEGSKHLLTFIAAGIFLIGLTDTKFFRTMSVIGIAFLFLYTFKAVDPYDYAVPFKDDDTMKRYEVWKNNFDRSVTLETDNTPNFGNVVIWVFDDTDSKGNAMNWQTLYALPPGFGISCCQADYVQSRIDHLQSRYILVANGSSTDELCKLRFTELSRDEKAAFYSIP